ncbi:MAG: hypothetical protein E2O39_11900 [Planctomycetota bacterium]|nr:MAG: hypothetical protein E2O39_11900 [Planctomycetota bacterium]
MFAAQVFYPDEYNGCFAACPDPIDFRSYCLVNIYEHEDAYWTEGPFARIERPAHRDGLGRIMLSYRSATLLVLLAEAVLIVLAIRRRRGATRLRMTARALRASARAARI